MSRFLSKSKYIAGLQCHKLLWYHYNKPDEFPEIDDATQAIFDQGHLIGELAQTLFPGGTEVEWQDGGFEESIKQTKKLLKKRKSIYEASFSAAGAYARADILAPYGRNPWKLIEVKSSSKAKEVHIDDLAFQQHCYQEAGLEIAKAILCLIDTSYVKNGEINPKHLFKLEDVSKHVAEALPDVPGKIEEMLDVIARADCPQIEVGPHCSSPYGCPLYEKCHVFLPEYNPLSLYRCGCKNAYQMIHAGASNLAKLSAKIKLNAQQQIQVEAIKTRNAYVDKVAIADFLRALKYPLYFLDFETMASAIPFFDGSRPYQAIPFQFSLHIRKAPGAACTHHSFLAEAGADPRPKFAKALKPLLGETGDIIAYNAGFEKGCLSDVVDFLPEYKKWGATVNARFVDLLAPFRSFYYHHPAQHGSNSIKKVLPALVGKSYDGMEIAEGGVASSEYVRTHFSEASETERQRVRTALEEYCKLDTQAMVDIIDALQKLIPGLFLGKSGKAK